MVKGTLLSELLGWRALRWLPCVLPFLLLAPSASAAHDVCGKTCAGIKEIMGDRSNGFDHLKGPRVAGVGTAWLTTLTLLDLECRISDNAPPLPNSFGCFAFHLKKRAAEETRARLLTAFRVGQPKWRWFRVRYSGRNSLWGGPEGELIADIEVERRGGDEYEISVGVYIDPTALQSDLLEPLLP